jgi:hypothetical protein
MHKRGWTYFKISGEIDGEIVTGSGRIPFVYETAEQFRPWLRLEVGNRLRIVDDGGEAVVYDGSGGLVARYAGGSFFKGLPRPWMGLHTIDTVRRDAAEQQIRFETRFKPGQENAEVRVSCGEVKLVYIIDMGADVVDKITFSTDDGSAGELRFSYLQDIEEAGDAFIEPPVSSYYGRESEQGMKWLLDLANGDW